MKGSCHCGKTRFDVDGKPDQALSCNCSICQRKGALMWFVPRKDVHLHTPETHLSSYTFNRHVIKHMFCPDCGIHVYGEGADPQGNAVAAINIRCLEDIDLEAIKVNHYNGRES